MPESTSVNGTDRAPGGPRFTLTLLGRLAGDDGRPAGAPAVVGAEAGGVRRPQRHGQPRLRRRHPLAEVTEQRAHASLRSTIWRVSQSCRGLLSTHGDMLELAPGVVVDVAALRDLFETMLPGSEREPTGESWTESACGDLLPGWYDDWVLLERERLRQMRVHALETMTRSLAEQGRYAEALEVGMAAVAVAPLRESAHREIIRIHLAEGNLSQALRQFEVCARRCCARTSASSPPTRWSTCWNRWSGSGAVPPFDANR